MIDKQAAADSNTITAPQYSAIPLGQLSIKELQPHIMIHILWRALKKYRFKYHLTANQLIMINGLYIYTRICKTEFTYRNAEKFVGYWNNLRTKKLIDSLILLGYVVVHSTAGNRVYYRLTPLSYTIGSELLSEFDSVSQRWYSKFNLSI